ncbi:putative NRPS-like protein biosynthetic cluster [Steccherinum ochraceum]|uniref:Putative NRPS-like protein biosynthetic cluster n=1 Tax=Steccherinum ochraceum TaxID=92696 RepID=A0A4R0RNN6_9APHY|nr:putative NRPS-like protein biosynthetic cluster [Steccherinum ochraceum]
MSDATKTPAKPLVGPFPPIPQTQALTSKTFRVPPVDGSHMVPDVWDWHLEYSPNHPVFVYTEGDGKEKVLAWRDVTPGIHRAGALIQSKIEASPGNRPIVAVLAASDSITYYLVQAGTVRANYIAFPISPRNSPAAVAHLLKKVGVSFLFIGPENNHQQLAAAAFKCLEAEGVSVPDHCNMPVYEDLMGPEHQTKLLPRYDYRPEETSIIIHSSGSTAFPKPIIGWHHRFLAIGLSVFYGAQDLCDKRIGCHSLPIYHGMGSLLLTWTAMCGFIVCVHKPMSPPIASSPENTMEAMLRHKCDFAFCVPSFIETWSKKPEDVEHLKKMTGVIYGGGPMNTHVGDFLAEQGVGIYSMYGSTEMGIPCQFVSEHPGKDWEYLNFNVPQTRVKWDYQPDGTAELIALPSPLMTPAVTNTIVNGEEAYATSDLFAPHPTKKGYWRVYGRTDDQIMHSTGEKTNPNPLELMLNQDPHVERVVMFGRGRFNAGILVDPKPAYKFDPKDEKKLAEFRNLIWPTVEKINEYAPQHSRLFKEMILVTSEAKPFTYTAKATPRRQAIINEYEPEIDAIYAAVAESSQADADLEPPKTWDLPGTLAFVRTVVSRVVLAKLKDSDDMFQKGCDSLQATWIRNSILHALREHTKVDTRSIPTSFVYMYPSIESLARYIASLTNPEGHANGAANGHDSAAAIISAMRAMVQTYRTSWPKHTGTLETPPKDTILVTGTTGSLGAGLLATLVADPKVEHIYALNRFSEDGSGLVERQKARLRDWGFDPSIADSEKVTLIEAHMSNERLGMSKEMYERVRKSITHVLHNGYRVNFNLSLTSFEPNVETVRLLIDLVLSSPLATPPRLEFISTIGVLGLHERNGPIKETPVDPASALGNGYTQSKWVNEELLSIAAKETPLRYVAVRVGQVTGGRTTGAWNRAEWFPTLVMSGQYLGCLPAIDKEISWIPVDAVAEAAAEMRNSPYPILHLAHPRPVPWNAIITPIARKLSLPLVPYTEWVDTLAASGEGLDAKSEVEMMKVNPALRILDFFMSARGGPAVESTKEAMAMPELSLERAVDVAQALGSKRLPKLGEKDALGWLAYW